ncbi:kielin/chordin-like protein [Centruroides vittatus]|uniref:kielin/chordin-like protein n=1 Tax=Centruroides vittatus TaxID=120091 RepID=UPI00350ED2BF
MALLFLSLLILSCYHVSSGAECLYQDTQYGEGETVKTSEPCLNCTCTSGVLICYLRVCTTVLPAPAGCVAKKQPGSCCADIICDEEEQIVGNPFASSQNNSLEVKISTSHSENNELKPKLTSDLQASNIDQNQTNMVISSTSYLTDEDLEGGCYINGSLYAEGSAMISSTYCHYCYCIRGKQVCLRPKCHLIIEGCNARYMSNYTCCPTHYVCDESYSSTSATTTSEATDTTTPKPSGCTIDDFTYSIGDAVPSTGHCQTCYCSREGIKCSPLQCSPIMDGCVPIIPEGHCCPVEYNCNFTQYPSKHTTNIFGWGAGEINETLSESSVTVPVLNLTTDYFEVIDRDKIEERYGDVDLNQSNRVLNQTESIESETNSNDSQTTTSNVIIGTENSSLSVEDSDVTDLNNDTSQELATVPIGFDTSSVETVTLEVVEITENSTETDATTETTTTTIENISTEMTKTENLTDIRSENVTEHPFTTEKTLATVTFNDFKRSRLEEAHRLPPPFLFLGSRLAVRPFGRGGVTRNPYINPNIVLRTTKPPLTGICVINGRTFMNGEVILRGDPCEVCRCISGREMCRRQECLPPPSPNCRMEKSPGFCCPHYICVNLPPPSIQRRPHIPTSAPHIPTSAPHIPTSAPHVPTSAPHIPTSAPHIPTSAPHIPTSAPIEEIAIETSKPTTTTESSIATLETTTEAPETTRESSEMTTLEAPTRFSFIDHLLSLMTPDPTDAKQDDVITEKPGAIPGSLVGNSWGVLRVSGCNVYGKFYSLHDKVAELSGRCKECLCDVTGVKCSIVC